MLFKFLSVLPHAPTLTSVSSSDIKRFLVWKDNFGKTKVHSYDCQNLGKHKMENCACPIRIAAGTVKNIIHHLIDIFEVEGRGRVYDDFLKVGNPAASSEIKYYLKLIQEEQAKAHVVPTQAKPIFLSKLQSISIFISNELRRNDLSLRERFVLVRDQALFKVQFFAGDRASDIALTLVQEVKYLRKKDGFVFNHSYGKTLRGEGKTNTFVLKRCANINICPVTALELYFKKAKKWGINMSTGILFRPVVESGRVLNEPMTYSSIYERLRGYLVTLGMSDGETPHSLRAGCAVHMSLSGAAGGVNDLMSHVGWSTERSAHYYSRCNIVNDAVNTAGKLATSTENPDRVEHLFRDYGDFDDLPTIADVL